ncbi:hypothetical protein CW676_00665 [Macrococcoides caseolyticum]|nr:hypothetical protein CW692_00650 [Macrococcus caseolyticus]PKE23447.1 hypothetical protein CW689_09095 [Macrococcus caseolyticus]PKE54548.1 hypothetical protein CW676_00665 [Macrococcus caseolyticus]PKF39413.1 hypothetical protein CW681_01945 [Macrococcus caseolyticus]
MKLKNFIGVIVYFITLYFSYRYFVAPIFGYSGLTYNPNISKLIISIIYILLLFIFFKDNRKPSSDLLYIIYINLFIPLVMFYWMNNMEGIYVFMVFISILTMLITTNKIKPFKVVGLPIRLSIPFEFIIYFLTLTLFILFILKYGWFDSRSLNFESIYQLRSEKEYSGMWAYLVNWLTKAFIPMLLVIFYFNRNLLLMLSTVCMQLIIYTSTGSKTLLFSSFYIIVLCFLIDKRWLKTGLPLLYSFLIFISMAIYKLLGNIYLLSIIPIRQLIIPAQVSYQHFNFFKFREKLYFSEGIIGDIFGLNSPYVRKSTLMVGDGKSNANTGIFSDAFDNGGFYLIFIYSVIFIIILLYINMIAAYWQNNAIFTSLFIYSMIILTDGSLLTTILTWGMFILLFSIIFINPRNEELSNGKFKYNG